MLRGVRDLARGIEPDAARAAAGYRLRGGSIVAPHTLSFEDTMVRRFGDPLGRVR
jgi:hypothetical protein